MRTGLAWLCMTLLTTCDGRVVKVLRRVPSTEAKESNPSPREPLRIKAIRSQENFEKTKPTHEGANLQIKYRLKGSNVAEDTSNSGLVSNHETTESEIDIESFPYLPSWEPLRNKPLNQEYFGISKPTREDYYFKIKSVVKDLNGNSDNAHDQSPTNDVTPEPENESELFPYPPSWEPLRIIPSVEETFGSIQPYKEFNHQPNREYLPARDKSESTSGTENVNFNPVDSAHYLPPSPDESYFDEYVDPPPDPPSYFSKTVKSKAPAPYPPSPVNLSSKEESLPLNPFPYQNPLQTLSKEEVFEPPPPNLPHPVPYKISKENCHFPATAAPHPPLPPTLSPVEHDSSVSSTTIPNAPTPPTLLPEEESLTPPRAIPVQIPSLDPVSLTPKSETKFSPPIPPTVAPKVPPPPTLSPEEEFRSHAISQTIPFQSFNSVLWPSKAQQENDISVLSTAAPGPPPASMVSPENTSSSTIVILPVKQAHIPPTPPSHFNPPVQQTTAPYPPHPPTLSSEEEFRSPAITQPISFESSNPILLPSKSEPVNGTSVLSDVAAYPPPALIQSPEQASQPILIFPAMNPVQLSSKFPTEYDPPVSSTTVPCSLQSPTLSLREESRSPITVPPMISVFSSKPPTEYSVPVLSSAALYPLFPPTLSPEEESRPRVILSLNPILSPSKPPTKYGSPVMPYAARYPTPCEVSRSVPTHPTLPLNTTVKSIPQTIGS